MLCSTPFNHAAFNDWLNVSPNNYNPPCTQIIFSPINSNDVPEISLHHIYPLEDDSAMDRDLLIANRYPMSILSGKSVFSPSNVSCKSSILSLDPMTPTLDVGHRPKTRPVTLESDYALSPLTSRNMTCLQNTPFDDCYRLSTPLASPNSYISPIVRASSFGYSDDVSQHSFPISTGFNFKGPSFLDRLHASIPSNSSSTCPDHARTSGLLSPCKSLMARPVLPQTTPKQKPLRGASSTPLSPLTPLTPLPEDAMPFQSPITQNLPPFSASTSSTSIKRRLATQDSPSPLSRPNKSRRVLRSSYSEALQLFSELETRHNVLPEPPSPRPAFQYLSKPIFTNRAFPSVVPISPDFPMFYRRFPASSFFQEPPSE
jgi:hypothetical protein